MTNKDFIMSAVENTEGSFSGDATCTTIDKLLESGNNLHTLFEDFDPKQVQSIFMNAFPVGKSALDFMFAVGATLEDAVKQL